MSDQAAWMTLTIVWMIALARLPALRGNARQRAGIVCMLSLTLSATASTPDNRRLLDSIIGVPDASILFAHAFAIFAMICSLDLAGTFAGGGNERQSRNVRGSKLALATALCVMLVLFVAIPRSYERPDFGLWQAHNAFVIAYQMLFQSCLGISLSAVAHPLTRARRFVGDKEPLRTALLLLTAGVLIGLGYVTSRMWYILTHGFGIETAIAGPNYGAATFLLLQACLLLLGVGAGLPLIVQSVRLTWRYLAYHRLYRLWYALTQAVPDVVLIPPKPLLRDIFGVKSMQLRLYRRMVEIRDAQLELIGYVPAGTRERLRAALQAHWPTADCPSNAVDACLIAAGMRLKQHGSPAVESQTGLPWFGDAEFGKEVADLLTLQRLVRSPAIAQIIDAVMQPGTATTGWSAMKV